MAVSSTSGVEPPPGISQSVCCTVRIVLRQLPCLTSILLLFMDMIMFRAQRAADSGRDKPNREQKQMLTNSRLACRSLISKSILQTLPATAAYGALNHFPS
jgi:hypothetical protein